MNAGADKWSHAVTINSRSHDVTVIAERDDEKSRQVTFHQRTFASQAAAALYAAINASTKSEELDQLLRSAWIGNSEGAISDDDAEFLQSLVDRMRPIARGRRQLGGVLVKLASQFTPRRRRKLTDEQKQEARERRRTLGGSSVMPPDLRCQYTEGERAVLAIVAGEIKHSGNCDLPIDKIAALAGVCRTTVQNALHEARRLRHINVTERPRHGKKSLTNIVHIVSVEWLTWLKRGPTAHRPGRIGSNSVSEKNLRSDESFVSPTKNTYFKKYSSGKEQWRDSGPPRAGWRKRA